MVDLMMPVSPLEDVLVQGRYGRSLAEGPGVTLSLAHPCDVVSVIAAKGKARALATAAKKGFGLTLPDMAKSSSARGMSAHSSAPDQWIIVAAGSAPGALAPKLEVKLGKQAMITDQSHGRVVMRISGTRARDVLAKGTAIDLRPGSFKPGMCSATQIGHVGVTIACNGPDSFDLIIGRTFVEGFWLGICELALEWGYEVR
jgi:sarcosine oxidase subunit gamma